MLFLDEDRIHYGLGITLRTEINVKRVCVIVADRMHGEGKSLEPIMFNADSVYCLNNNKKIRIYFPDDITYEGELDGAVLRLLITKDGETSVILSAPWIRNPETHVFTENVGYHGECASSIDLSKAKENMVSKHGYIGGIKAVTRVELLPVDGSKRTRYCKVTHKAEMKAGEVTVRISTYKKYFTIKTSGIKPDYCYNNKESFRMELPRDISNKKSGV